jgi:hypothetical protein
MVKRAGGRKKYNAARRAEMFRRQERLAHLCSERDLSPGIMGFRFGNTVGVQAELAKELKVSPATISKDLAELRKNPRRQCLCQACRTKEDRRALENARLDELQASRWEAALEGDPKAFKEVLMISDRRRELNGLDAPKTEGSAGGDTRLTIEFLDSCLTG